jgi:hypothetical protein
MALRFADPAISPLPEAHPMAAHLKYDERLGRWRWGFSATLQLARQRTGRDLTPEEAVAAIAPEFAASLAHIDAEPPDQTVFGVVYELNPAIRRGPADAAKAAQSRKNAEAVVDKALAVTTQDFLREGFIAAAVEILRDSSRGAEGNNLQAASELVRFLYLARTRLEALAEWADLFCRVASAAGVFRRLGRPDDPIRARVAAAYQEFQTGLLTMSLESDSILLEARRLYDPARLAAFPLRPSTIDEAAQYLRTYSVNWLQMVCQTPDTMRYFQVGVGTVERVREAVRALFRVWREAHLAVYPPVMKAVLIECAGALNLLLTRPVPVHSDFRVAACLALGEIPLYETVDLLKPHLQDADPAVRKQADEALRQIAAAFGFG